MTMKKETEVVLVGIHCDATGCNRQVRLRAHHDRLETEAELVARVHDLADRTHWSAYTNQPTIPVVGATTRRQRQPVRRDYCPAHEPRANHNYYRIY